MFGYANEQLVRAATREITDLEAMALIVDQSALVYDGDWGGMLPALTMIFNGTSETAPNDLYSSAFETEGCAGVGRSENDCPSGQYHFGDSGFHEDFQDSDNQLYHLWGMSLKQQQQKREWKV